MDPKEVIHQYLLGNLDSEAVRQLDRMLAEDSALRREFAQVVNVDAALREESIERSIEEVHTQSRPETKSNSKSLVTGFRFLAVCAAIALVTIMFGNRQPATVATLASSENAAWVSALPTSPGSELTSGTLDLKSGIATLVFHSGAEMTIEAPAQVELLSAMRAKLFSGAAVMNVPDTATGFVLETPDGYVIDFGTKFAVRIDAAQKLTDFELIEGEIEVHQPTTGKSLRLTEVGAGASVSRQSLRLIEESMQEDDSDFSADWSAEVIRLSTQGRCATALHNERRRKKAIHFGYLYASHTKNGKWDTRSYIGFDTSSIDPDRLATAKLRLNQVQSYRGSAALLPKINEFAIYGITSGASTEWQAEPGWDESPTREDGVLVGTFRLPRSRMRGPIEIESPELLPFLKQSGGRPVTFLLTRVTGRIDGTGPAMPHMFASDKHPEAVGPLLELTLK